MKKVQITRNIFNTISLLFFTAYVHHIWTYCKQAGKGLLLHALRQIPYNLAKNTKLGIRLTKLDCPFPEEMENWPILFVGHHQFEDYIRFKIDMMNKRMTTPYGSFDEYINVYKGKLYTRVVGEGYVECELLIE